MNAIVVFMVFAFVLLIFALLFTRKKARNPEFKTCPYCAEGIKFEATVCKHCKRNLPKSR